MTNMEFRIIEAFNAVFIATMCIGLIGRMVIFVIKDLLTYWNKKDKKNEA